MHAFVRLYVLMLGYMGEIVGDSVSCGFSGVLNGVCLHGYELRALEFISLNNGCSLAQLANRFNVQEWCDAGIYARRLVRLGLVRKKRCRVVVLFRLTDSGKTYLDYLLSINGIPEHPHKRKKDQEQRVKRQYNKRTKVVQVNDDEDILGLF